METRTSDNITYTGFKFLAEDRRCIRCNHAFLLAEAIEKRNRKFHLCVYCGKENDAK